MEKLNNFVEKHFMKLALPLTFVIVVLVFAIFDLTSDKSVIAETLNWKDEVIYEATTDLATTGQETVDELLAKEIKVGSPEDIAKYIQAQQAELDRLLVEYYNAQISGLMSEKDLRALKAQIDNIRNNMYIEYQKQIDEKVNQYK